MTIFLFSVGIERIDFPSSRISPSSGLIKPVIILRIVVLPHPEGPNNAINSPSWISKFTLSTAGLSILTKFLERLFILT